MDLLDINLLDEDDPFEMDRQEVHLAKHPGREARDAFDVWESDPVFYPAKPPADWLMVGDVGGSVLVVPIAKADSGKSDKCRPIGCYPAPPNLERQYREDRRKPRDA